MPVLHVGLVAAHELAMNAVGLELLESDCKIFVELLTLESIDQVKFHLALLQVVAQSHN